VPALGHALRYITFAGQRAWLVSKMNENKFSVKLEIAMHDSGTSSHARPAVLQVCDTIRALMPRKKRHDLCPSLFLQTNKAVSLNAFLFLKLAPFSPFSVQT
jgi:hypothetical protein